MCVCVCVLCVRECGWYVGEGEERKGKRHTHISAATYMIRPLCRVDSAASITIGQGNVKIEHAIERCGLSLTEVGAHDACLMI